MSERQRPCRSPLPALGGLEDAPALLQSVVTSAEGNLAKSLRIAHACPLPSSGFPPRKAPCHRPHGARVTAAGSRRPARGLRGPGRARGGSGLAGVLRRAGSVMPMCPGWAESRGAGKPARGGTHGFLPRSASWWNVFPSDAGREEGRRWMTAGVPPKGSGPEGAGGGCRGRSFLHQTLCWPELSPGRAGPVLPNLTLAEATG